MRNRRQLMTRSSETFTAERGSQSLAKRRHLREYKSSKSSILMSSKSLNRNMKILERDF
jgi:hypothetical protein